MTTEDEAYLRRAIAIALEARAAGEDPYGSLLVGHDGAILAEDHNTVRSSRDITAHPELKLARWAAFELTPEVAAGTTMYTSCEPCILCVGAIERSGLGRVVYALSTEQFYAREPGEAALRDAVHVEYEGPALLSEALAPIEGYYPRS